MHVRKQNYNRGYYGECNEHDPEKNIIPEYQSHQKRYADVARKKQISSKSKFAYEACGWYVNLGRKRAYMRKAYKKRAYKNEQSETLENIGHPLGTKEAYQKQHDQKKTGTENKYAINIVCAYIAQNDVAYRIARYFGRVGSCIKIYHKARAKQ